MNNQLRKCRISGIFAPPPDRNGDRNPHRFRRTVRGHELERLTLFINDPKS